MPKTDIGFSVGLDLAAFKKSWAQAGDLAKSQAAAMQKVLLQTAGVLAVAFGVGKFSGMIAGSVEAGKAVDSLSRKSGMAAEDILLMTHALDRSGQTAESTTGIMTEMRDKMREAAAGSSEARLTFQGMGLDIGKLQGMKPAQQFATIAKAVNSIKDPASRSAAAVALLGANGAEAAASFNAGDMERASKLFGVSAKGMAEAAPALARASEAFKRIQEGGKAFFDIIVAKLAPYIEMFATAMEELIPKIEEMAETFATKLKGAVEIVVGLFKRGDIGKALKLSFEWAVRELANILTGTFIFAGKVLGEAMFAAFKMLSSGKVFSGIFKALQSLGSFLMGVLLDAFSTPVKWFQDHLQAAIEWVMEKMSKMGLGPEGFKARSAEEIGKTSTAQLATAGGMKGAEELMAEIDEAGKGFGEFDASGFRDLSDRIPKLWAESSTNMFSKPELNSQLAGLLGNAQKEGSATLAKLKKPAALKPGEEKGGGIGALGSINFFDTFRKVGGGMGGAALTDIPKETLNVNKRMDDKLGRLIELTGGGVRFSTSTGSLNFSSP